MKAIDTGELVNITDANGKVVEVIDPADFSEDITRRLIIHGLKQKINDAKAGVGDDETESLTRMRKVVANLRADIWSTRRHGSSRKSIYQRAFEEFASSSDIGTSSWDDLTEDEKKEVRGDKGFKLIVARMRFEEAQKAAEQG